MFNIGDFYLENNKQSIEELVEREKIFLDDKLAECPPELNGTKYIKTL